MSTYTHGPFRTLSPFSEGLNKKVVVWGLYRCPLLTETPIEAYKYIYI